MDSESGLAVSRKKSGKFSVCHFSCSRHWPNILLIAIIAIVSIAVVLLLLPYILRDQPSVEVLDPLSCSPTLYTGSVCLKELQEWQSCLPERQNVSANVFIPSDVDQELSESRAEMLFAGLQLAGTSQECEREFKSFWCLLLFGLCDGSGQRRLPSSDQCTRLQTDTCSEIIQIAATVPEYSVIIQNCDNFRLSTSPCRNESDVGSRRDFNVSCSEDFFYDESSLVCKPTCGVWTHLSPQADTAIFVLSIIGDVASIVICSAILVLSIVQYKRIFTFPSALMIYPTLTVFVASLFDLIGQLSLQSMLCASDDLIENIIPGGSTTGLCKAQAGVFIYAVLVISLFWLFQTVIYFWVVIYPIHYRSFTSTGKLKFVHVTVVAVSFLLPVIPLLPADIENEFGINLLQRRKCNALNEDFVFYGIVVPIDAIIICGISLLIITIWSIGKVNKRLLKKHSQEWPKLKSTEVKLIVIILNYLFLGLYTILSTTVSLRNIGDHQRVLLDHFTCEALGDDTITCSRNDFQQLQRDSFIQVFVYIGFNLYPSIFFIFLIPCKMCKRKTSSVTSNTS